ncbi:MAG: BREX-6 system phosphatase PglZ [Planctomycetota bacterium]
MVVHMPGFNKQSVRGTPLLEMYLAGCKFEPSLSTSISDAAAGKVLPNQIDAYLAGTELSLADADQWLASMLGDTASTLTGRLRLVTTESLIDDLLTPPPAKDPLSSQITGEDDVSAIWERFGAALGLPLLWRDQTIPTTTIPTPEAIAFVASSWALSIEYVDDLNRAPVDPHLNATSGLATKLVENCRALAEHLRGRHPDFYTRTADETEAMLPDEVERARPEDLGKIDTFRFEETKMLSGAIEALQNADWNAAADWAGRRIQDESFWLSREATRRSAWLLVDDAAKLGGRIAEAGASLNDVNDFSTLLDRYANLGAPVDRAHRQLEQRRHALLGPRLPDFDKLRTCLDSLRQVWREWADGWARDFNVFCSTHGFMPPSELQQRNLFDQVVSPMMDATATTALFVIDAFRYEMAAELMQHLTGERLTSPRLDARLAELPTVTSVGMNALAPVVRNGQMKPQITAGKKGETRKIDGFQTGEYRVFDPDSRKRAMHDRVGGSTCPLLMLQEVVDRDATSLKRSVARAKLVIVHSKEIDTAGEAGFGPAVFDAVTKNIRRAWRLLREAGVKQFVFTADHGFLLRDGLDNVQWRGSKVTPDRRHLISPIAVDQREEVRVPLRDLGYDDTDDHLIFPMSTAAFDKGKRLGTFVHGGNSLQERVIPVLTLSHRADIGGNTLKYQVHGLARDGVGGMHCLAATINAVSEQPALDFSSHREIEIAVRSIDAPSVTAELCQVRGGGSQIAGGSVLAAVGEEFELFFRLRGDTDARVEIELYHPGAEADVTPAKIYGRFAVELTTPPPKDADLHTPVDSSNPVRLEQFEDPGIRRVFEHIAEHGVITETELVGVLGTARQARRFASKFESLAAKAPFEVRIDVVGSGKRYVREHETEYTTSKDMK